MRIGSGSGAIFWKAVPDELPGRKGQAGIGAQALTWFSARFREFSMPSGFLAVLARG
jgi:hypothetical protein